MVYNFQHIVLVSKCRFKVFKNPKTQKIVADAFREVEMRFNIKIKELAFGEDYAHVHMEINVPSQQPHGKPWGIFRNQQRTAFLERCNPAASGRGILLK